MPEVETVVRSIAPFILGKLIVSASFYSARVTRQDHVAAAAAIAGAAVQRIRRRGKQILVDLDRGLLYMHLGMTGKLLWQPGDHVVKTKHTRALLQFLHGTLLYDDPRMFGRVEFYVKSPLFLEQVGPDALTVSAREFDERLSRHRGRIKPVLLNQKFLAGVGNIYADEALFAAGIHPRALVQRLSKQRRAHLHTHLLEILAAAVHLRGSSISDYVDSEGVRGSYQQHHNVYGRAGELCPRCGTSIKRIVLAQRGTHYCPRCQRA